MLGYTGAQEKISDDRRTDWMDNKEINNYLFTMTIRDEMGSFKPEH